MVRTTYIFELSDQEADWLEAIVDHTHDTISDADVIGFAEKFIIEVARQRPYVPKPGDVVRPVRGTRRFTSRVVIAVDDQFVTARPAILEDPDMLETFRRDRFTFVPVGTEQTVAHDDDELHADAAVGTVGSRRARTARGHGVAPQGDGETIDLPAETTR